MIIPLFEHGLLVNGVWGAASDGIVATIVDPSTGAPIARCASASRRDVRRALGAAASCAEEGRWAAMAQADRARMVIEALAGADRDALAEITSRETGTPITTARAEVRAVFDGAMWLLETAVKGATALPEDLGDAYVLTARAPHGVVVVIASTITPLRDMLWRVVPALVAGNAVVVTTSAETPCAVLQMCAAFTTTLPRDVLHCVAPGSPVIWDELAGSTYVSRVLAAGPPDLLRRAASLAAANLVPCAMRDDEPSAAIVLDDADLDVAAAALLLGLARHAGQSHHACARIAVQDPASADPLLEALAARAAVLHTGPTDHDATEVGPLISADALARTRRGIERARGAGAGIRCGGHPLSDEGLAGGFYHAPTVLAGDIPDPAGPVLGVVVSDDIPGRASRVAVFTADAQRALPYAQRPGVAAIWVNGHPDEDARISTAGRAGSGTGAAFGDDGARAADVPVAIRLR